MRPPTKTEPTKSNVIRSEVTIPTRYYLVSGEGKQARKRSAYLVYGATVSGKKVEDACIGYICLVEGTWEAHAKKQDGQFSERNVSLILGPDYSEARSRETACNHLVLHLRRHDSGQRLLIKAGLL